MDNKASLCLQKNVAMSHACRHDLRRGLGPLCESGLKRLPKPRLSIYCHRPLLAPTIIAGNRSNEACLHSLRLSHLMVKENKMKASELNRVAPDKWNTVTVDDVKTIP